MSQTQLEDPIHRQGSPTKVRRIRDARVPTQYGPVDEDLPARNLGLILLTAENENPPSNLFDKLRSFTSAPRVDASTLAARQAKYAAEHEDLAAFYYSSVQRTKAITRLRNEVEELRAYETVYFDRTNNYWLVEMSSARSYRPELPLFVGQCPVLVREGGGTFGTGNSWLMNTTVNPRAIVDDNSCSNISRAFPSSIGMRVYTFGHVEILYESKKKMKLDLYSCEKIPYTIGEFNHVLKVVKVTMTSGLPATNPARTRFVGVPSRQAKIELSSPVAGQPHTSEPRGCVGLRIHRECDTEDSWTTVTHPWCKNAPYSTVKKFELLLRMGKANVVAAARRLERLGSKSASAGETRGSNQHKRAVAVAAKGREYPTVLGATVYAAGSNIKIGTITHCYDCPPLPESSLAPVFAFDHDLSLVTASNEESLPLMLKPRAFAQPETKFATPNEILGADSPQAFFASYNLQFDKRKGRAGHIVKEEGRQAVITGAEYWWERQHLKTKRSIIWRTLRDNPSVAAGGVICLGHPAAKTCRAAVFQNYESRIVSTKERCYYQGGFLLPADVQAANIILESSPRLID